MRSTWRSRPRTARPWTPYGGPPVNWTPRSCTRPREWPEYHPGYYAVSIRDPDSDNVEVVRPQLRGARDGEAEWGRRPGPLPARSLVPGRTQPWDRATSSPKVGDKIFAFLGGGDGVGLKCGANRDEADELVDAYPEDVSKMAYIGRSGWNTVRLGGCVPDDEILELIDTLVRDDRGQAADERRPGPAPDHSARLVPDRLRSCRQPDRVSRIWRLGAYRSEWLWRRGVFPRGGIVITVSGASSSRARCRRPGCELVSSGGRDRPDGSALVG